MVTPGDGLGGAVEATASSFGERRLPPVQSIAVASMICVLSGGVYLAAYLPRHAALAPAVGLLAAAMALLVANAALLSRLKDFDWRSFRTVSGRALCAYLVIAGMIEYVFVYDKTRGSMLLVMSLMLAVFAVDVPVLLGFSVARYQRPSRLPQLQA